jgi:hypothetical protein
MVKYRIEPTADGHRVVRPNGRYFIVLGACGMSSREEAEECVRLLMSSRKCQSDYDWYADHNDD